MKFWKIEKNNFTISTPKGPPFEKKIKKIKFFVSFSKNHTIFTWIWILHVLSFLLRYIISVFQNFQIFIVLAMKFPPIATFIFWFLMAKIVIIGDYFGNLWTAKQEFYAELRFKKWKLWEKSTWRCSISQKWVM